MIHHNQPPSYGSGLCYSLALFISHEANVKYALAEVELMAAEGALRFDGNFQNQESGVSHTVERLAATRWFSRAAKPLRDICLESNIPSKLADRLNHLRKQCLKWSAPESPKQGPMLVNIQWAIEEAKEIIRLIDEHHGVRTVKESHSANGLKEPAIVFRD